MAPPGHCRQGVLAFGDSITNGGGELQWGVALQSWAQWVARALGLPLTNHAFDGARAADVTGRQIPAFERVNALPDARYELGCLYIGVNDARSPDFDAREFEREFGAGLAFVNERCDRVVTLTIPLDLARPRVPDAVVAEANGAIERVARSLGALIVDLRDFRARNFVMADRIHPTAFGQIAIAERALAVLAAAGMEIRVQPRALIEFETTRLGRLRGDARYVRRYLKQAAFSAFGHR
jgi:lysophospholipase L1-like esterase